MIRRYMPMFSMKNQIWSDQTSMIWHVTLLVCSPYPNEEIFLYESRLGLLNRNFVFSGANAHFGFVNSYQQPAAVSFEKGSRPVKKRYCLAPAAGRSHEIGEPLNCLRSSSTLRAARSQNRLAFPKYMVPTGDLYEQEFRHLQECTNWCIEAKFLDKDHENL